MPQAEWHFEYVLVYFVYGLAFFSMGIALTLETGRVPMLAERKIIRPLALFGLMHGMHEWIEVILVQATWATLPLAAAWLWIRAAWLAISFFPLLVFGIRGFLAHRDKVGRGTRLVAFGLIGLSVSLLVVGGWFLPTRGNSPILADVWTRYSLAVPASWLAAVALLSMAKNAQLQDRSHLVHYFQWTSAGMLLYGISQLFVARADFFPAEWINADLFLEIFGFPIQIIRAGAAVWITYQLILALHEVEQERAVQLEQAQQSRLEAMQQIQRELVEREAMRKELLSHIVIAQEEERARIARELHDETSQALAAFSLHLAALKDMLPAGIKLKEQIVQLQELSRQISQGIYRLIHDLRPAQLDDLGLVAALEYLADEEMRRNGLDVAVKIEGDPRRLDPLVEVACFRIAQEGLTNVARHAGVRQAEVRLHYSYPTTTLIICDRGVGFDTRLSQIPPHGWGLIGMRERAESVGGSLDIESAPGQGTRIGLQIGSVTTPEFVRE